MKKLFLLLFIFCGLASQAQWTRPNTSYGAKSYRGSIDSTLLYPTGCGTPSLRLAGSTLSGDTKKSAIYFDSCGHVGYLYDPSTATWAAIGSGSAYTAGTGLVLQGNVFKIRDTLEGVGTKLMWLSAIGAFRAGTVSGTQWNMANIGVNSVAFGTSTKASGTGSAAFGAGSTSSGDYSFSSGTLVTNSSENGFAAGQNLLNTSSASAIFGYNSSVKGEIAFVAGAYLKSNHPTGAVFGLYNDSTNASATNFPPSSTDRIFQIGNGSADAVRSNAVTVLYNGNVGIGTPTPTVRLDVSGSIHASDNVEFVGIGNNTIGKIADNVYLRVSGTGVSSSIDIVAPDINITGKVNGILEYWAIVSQVGIGNPTVTEVKNTTGETFTWTRIAAGEYQALCSNPILTTGKTGVEISNHSDGTNANSNVWVTSYYVPNTTKISIMTQDGLTASNIDDVLDNTLIKVSIFP